MNDERVTILWTGGWDSTYRMVELSMRSIKIQPIYVLSPGRKSVPYELKAMETIVEILSKKEKTKAVILPLKIIKRDDIPKNEEVSKAYRIFAKEAHMGDQHDYLARLALQMPMMELCIEKALGEHMPVRKSIQRYGKLIDTGDGLIIDQGQSSKELNLVLGNLKLPIFNKTELEMQSNIKNWGYEDVMEHIWFCHNPINGKPCGFCAPCTTKMTSEMVNLLPEQSRKRFLKKKEIKENYGKFAAKMYCKIVRIFS